MLIWNNIHISNNNPESAKVEFETPPAIEDGQRTKIL